AIPVDAPNPEAALTFINYILDQKVIADVTNYVYYANANAEATPLVAEDIRNDPGTYPPQEMRDKLYPIKSYAPDFLRTLNRAWTSFKSGQ
ncbi:MAG: spermidine/putrescine ABC transporter substrate-binding protein PotF, partial [Albidovulum sp.]